MSRQELLDDCFAALDAVSGDLALLETMQNVVCLVLRRTEDALQREQTLEAVTRYCMSMTEAADLSDEYRTRKLKLFAKETVKLLIDARHPAATTPGDGLNRRAGDKG